MDKESRKRAAEDESERKIMMGEGLKEERGLSGRKRGSRKREVG